MKFWPTKLVSSSQTDGMQTMKNARKGTSFWADLSNLSGTTLHTLGRRRAFDIISVDEKRAVIRPHESMIDRTIAKKSFDGVFAAIRLEGSLDLKGIRTFCEMNPVYVAAMIAQLPYVDFSSSPKIVLWYLNRPQMDFGN